MRTVSTKQYWGKENWKATERTMAQHKRVLNEVNGNISKYGYNGMWHLTNMKIVSHEDGYQVLFWAGDEQFTPEEYARITNEFLRYSTNHEADITKTNGISRISFHIPNIRDAYRLARKYGDNSVWNWMSNKAENVERKRRS